MLRVVGGFTLLSCVWVLSVPGAAYTNTPSTGGAPSSAHVYFLTGRFGVGPGLEGVAGKVKKRGLPITMSSPSGWPSLSQSAIKGYNNEGLRSIVIVGFSAGGRAALNMAAELNTAQVPVQLVAIIDAISVPPVSPNVRKLVNYYMVGGLGNPITRPSDFRGVLQNIPVKGPNVSHFSIVGVQEQELLGHVLSAASL